LILLDANLLLYAKISEFPEHGRARSWLEERLNDAPRVGMPWPSLLAFLRIATNARVFPSPLAPDDAWKQVTDWLALPNVWIPLPTERHEEILGQLIRTSSAVADLVPDAHLAALAMEHGLTLCSTDGDFARFDGLRWLDPLAE